jgi:hypothetical protein
MTSRSRSPYPPQAAGHAHGFANPLFYANPAVFYDVVSVKTAVARRNFVNSVDTSAPAHRSLRLKSATRPKR